MPQAIPGALEVVLTQDLLAYLGRPILRNNHLPLRACSDKTSHPVAHLVGVHLVRRVPPQNTLPRTHIQQVQTPLARSHLYSGKPPNNSRRLAAAALVCLGPSNNRTPKTKVNRVPLDSSGINQGLDRQILHRRGNHNRVDVRHHSIVLSNHHQRTTQYLATLRPNSPAPDCLAILEETVCLGTPSSKVRSSKLVNRPPLACSATSRPLQ